MPAFEKESSVVELDVEHVFRCRRLSTAANRRESGALLLPCRTRHRLAWRIQFRLPFDC